MQHTFNSNEEKSDFLRANEGFIGRIVVLYPNGKKRSEGDYFHCRRHGKYEEWYCSGNLSESSNFNHGFYHGVYQNWYENGNFCEISTMENGQFQGKRTVYYRTGGKWYEAQYEMGKFHGLYEAWTDWGGKMIQGLYVNNMWMNGYYYNQQISNKALYRPDRTLSLNYAKYT